MLIRGIVQSAEFVEDPPDSGRIEMVIRVQGVGRDQPRRLVIPFEILLLDPTIEPESVRGRSFEAEVVQDPQQVWIVSQLSLAAKDVLGKSQE